MGEKKYKLYLASGIKLWSLFFKDEYSSFFNRKIELFQPALLDSQHLEDHRKIPIRIATKDLGEINKCDAILAYMKMYNTENNGPAGTDSTWECGYAIGGEKPTIMLVENLEHLDYYSAQWMVTFSIGAILTTDKKVADYAKNHDKFTHTTILFAENKEQMETKIIEYLDKYYKSIYAREGIINYSVDEELRRYANISNIKVILEKSKNNPFDSTSLEKRIFEDSETKFNEISTYKLICNLEYERAVAVKQILEKDLSGLTPFLYSSINKYLSYFEGGKNLDDISEMISYWLNIPAEEIKDRRQGKKKTRPTIFYELYDLVSHHIIASQRPFAEDFVYKAGAILEVYNWLNTYAIDDVFDNSETRQGNKTLHIKFESRKDALLLGGIGHCLSLLLLFELTKDKEEISKKLLISLNNVQSFMYLGQPIDIDLTFDNKRILKKFIKENNLESALKKYFNRIYGICGAFYEEIGRMAMKSTNVSAQFYNQEEAEESCIYIAKLFGLVQMIRNDLGDLIFPEDMSDMSKGMKGSSHNDVMEGKLTLPIIYTIFNPNTNSRDKKKIIKAIGDKKLNLEDKIEISRIIWESGSIEYSMQFIEYYSNLVREQYIKHIHETPTRLKWIIKLMDITPLINLTFRRMAINNKWCKLEPQILSENLIKELDNITNMQTFLASNNQNII